MRAIFSRMLVDDEPTVRWLVKRVRSRIRPKLYGHLPAMAVVSMPKSGTHLLTRLVTLLGGQERIPLTSDFARSLGARLDDDAPETIPWGIGNPCRVSTAVADRILGSLWRGEFAFGHIPYSNAFVEVTRRHHIAVLHIIRDPRDAAVSHIHHVVRAKTHRLHDYFVNTLQTFEQQLLASIVGISSETGSNELLPNVHSRIASIRPWLDAGGCYTTRFERLVGPNGGGAREAQIAEIAGIAQHLGLSLSESQQERIASLLFGQGSKTFRKGKAGGWRDSFNAEHVAAFKELAGADLIALGYETDFDW